MSVRAVAAELGVTPMALYRHVPNADGLHDAVIDRLLDGLPLVADDGTCGQRCRSWAYGARDVLVGAPGLARYVLLHWTALPKVLEVVDGLGSMFERHGPTGVDAVAASNAVFTYVLMRAQAEEAVRGHGAVRDLHLLLERRHELPFLWRHRADYAAARFDEHFDYGLEVLLAGLATARPRERNRRAHS